VEYSLVIEWEGRDKSLPWKESRRDFPWAGAEPTIAALGAERALRMLYHASYTPPAADCAGYLAGARDEVEVRFYFYCGAGGSNPNNGPRRAAGGGGRY